nr:phosphatase PAP2 family protein [Streptomyces sulphureus]
MLRRTGGRVAMLAASLMVVSVGVQPVSASGADTAGAPSADGYWSTSYEAGTPRPAGFAGRGPAENLRGETTRVNTTVESVASNHPNDERPGEHVSNLADDDGSTKWYARGSGKPTSSRPVHAIYRLADPAAVTRYSLTAGDDAAPRDPRAWTVLGSNSPDAASDADDPSWTTLDSKAEQDFDKRLQTNFYSIDDPGRYRYYQLRVTENCAERCDGSSDDHEKLQIADWTLRSSAGTRASALGASVENAESVGAADGSHALRYAGRTLQQGGAGSTVVVRSELDVSLGDDAELTYAIRPTDAASAHAALDVVYTDPDGSHPRTVTSDGALRDTDGRPQDAEAHGATLTPGSWNRVSVDLGDLAGKRVTDVLLRYDNPAAKAAAPVSGWVDDIELGKAAVDSSTTWSYLDAPDVDPADGAQDRTEWTRPDFDTGNAPWKEAGGPFGVKDDGTDLGEDFPVETKLNLHKETGDALEAYFFRTSFTMEQSTIDALTGLAGSVVYDDTATVYLNGRRVTGWNDSEISKNLQYQTPDGTGGEKDPARSEFTVPASQLRAGENTLAVEVHQANSTSSDAYFELPRLAQTDASQPFTDSQLDTAYDSDELPDAPDGGDYFTWLLRSFEDASGTPSLMGPNEELPKGTTYDELEARNDRKVVDINNAHEERGDPQVRKALVDGAGSPYETMEDGLGSALGPLYKDALKNGELPKTKALLSRRVEKTPTSDDDWYQTAKDNYQYKRPFVRMGFTNDEGLIRQWDTPEGYEGLAGDGSFPSGHTSHGYAQGIVMATLLPELAPQILARASEYGDNRILLSFHYPTDIMGGRIVGAKTAQVRWSDPQFRTLLMQAKGELRGVLAHKCREAGAGTTLGKCLAGEKPYLPTAEALDVYEQRMTYGFPQIGSEDLPPSVPQGAEDLLLTAFPKLSADERRAVLAATQIESGYALDDRDGAGSWQRLNLAAAMSAEVGTDADGRLTVNGTTVDTEGVPVKAPDAKQSAVPGSTGE